MDSGIMSQCSGSPLDDPSCPMVRLDGMDSRICHSAVGHIGVHWTFHLVPWYSRTVRTVGYVTVQWDIQKSIGHSILSHVTVGWYGQ